MTTEMEQEVSISGPAPQRESKPHIGRGESHQSGLCANPRCRKDPNGTHGPLRVHGQRMVAPTVGWLSVAGAGPTPKGPKLIRITKFSAFAVVAGPHWIELGAGLKLSAEFLRSIF